MNSLNFAVDEEYFSPEATVQAAGWTGAMC